MTDLSAHGVRFLSKSTTKELILYYLYTLSVLLELFLTLTFLLATLRVLFSLNTHREILALQMAGLSKKLLLAPFFSFAAFLSLLCYANSQWLAPNAQDITGAFKVLIKPKRGKLQSNHVFSVPLSDCTEIVYRSYDPDTRELSDVFWIRKPDDIWHMKAFYPPDRLGKNVDHLTRNPERQMERLESFASRSFPEMAWDEKASLKKFIPLEQRPLCTLLIQVFSDASSRSGILAHLLYKFSVPLMPFLVLIAIAPFSLRFSRHHPLFLISAISIFGLIGLKTILDGMLILGENQVLPASLAILGPIVLTLALSMPPFMRMK